jgi:hypothetical protein
MPYVAFRSKAISQLDANVAAMDRSKFVQFSSLARNRLNPGVLGGYSDMAFGQIQMKWGKST